MTKEKNATSYKERRARLVPDLKILAIDSSHDELTQASCVYRNRHVYPYLESKGFELVRCQDQSARRIHVEQETCQEDLVYITGVGHGTCTTYMGENDDPIFDIGNYRPEESKGKIVHFSACQTAAKLGPDFVNHGCRAYFGYNENFITYMHVSDAFFSCDSEIDRAFADGLTAAKVHDRVIACYNQKICELKDGGHYRAAAALEHNRDHLCTPSVDQKWGNKEAILI